MRIKRPHAATIRVFAIAITAVMCMLVILSAAFPFPEGQWDFLSIGTGQQVLSNPSKTRVVFTSTPGGGIWTIPDGVTSVDVLVVAGGAGGGKGRLISDTYYVYGGGGGAGGLIWRPGFGVTAGTNVTVTVGGGGAGSTSYSSNGGMGSDSVFSTLTAKGGGGGGSSTPSNGSNGGSGGGGRGCDYIGNGGTGTQPSQSGDSGTYGYGNNGANGNVAGGGGGGGAASAGSGQTGGSGKNMYAIESQLGNDYGVSGVYSKGGDGNDGYDSPVAGGANTGNGGQGGSINANGAGGGSGIVIVLYEAMAAPTVTTQAATDVLSTSCTGNGNITATGGENCSTRGFCYMVGTSGDPTTANSTAYDTGSFGLGTYTKSITGLSPGTGYRVRAYAINSGGTGYGTTVQVTTPCSPSISNTPSTWNVHSGIVVPVSSQYTTGLGYFNLTNTNSGGAVTVTIHGHDMTGGNTWTLSDTAAPASMTYGLKTSTDAKTLYEYYNAGDDDHYGFYSQYWIGQSFNSSTSHTITGVKLKLWRGLEDLPGTITISIRATDGSGLPTGSDLAVGTTNGNTLPESSPGEWREITFDNCYTLSASTEYSIIGRCEAYSAFWRLDKTSPSYSGGCLVESNNSGSSWVNNATYDLMFEEYGGSFSTIVKKSETYNTLVASLANNASQLWGLLMYTPTVYTDGVPKSGNITLTVVCT